MKILLADANSALLQSIIDTDRDTGFEWITASTGPEALKKIRDHGPALVVVDIMLPIMHGIEITKILKSLHPEIGIVVTSFQTMIQNYKAAIDAGANYFLSKPFDPATLINLAKIFRETGVLQPAPFTPQRYTVASNSYIPKPSPLQSFIRFWGTRGSNPVAGNEYLRFGGNTSCLEIRHGNQVIIIDAGTGIRRLGELICEEAIQETHLIISHTHWDHIAGFPFFSPIYKKEGSVVIWSPVGYEKSTNELFTEMLAYAYFPVRLEEMNSEIMFKEMRDHRALHFGEIAIDTRFTIHPGPTLGFKIISPTKKIGYITDNEAFLGYTGHPNNLHRSDPLCQPYLELIDFLSDCDVIIHEAQYFPEEYTKKIGWGTLLTNATALIKMTNCREWIVTHHDPRHTDAMLEAKLRLHQEVITACDMSCAVHMAYDGMIIPLM